MIENNDFAGASRISTDDAIEALLTWTNDAAFVDVITHKMKSTGLWSRLNLPIAPVRTNTPPPVISTNPTAIQFAVFDNGVRSQKSVTTRFRGSIEVWTGEEIKFGARRNSSHRISFGILDRRRLKETIKAMAKPGRRYPANESYLEMLKLLAEPNGELAMPDARIGLLATRIKGDDPTFDPGYFYHPFQFVLLSVDKEGRASNARLFLGIDSPDIKLGRFVDRDAAGRPFAEKVVCQSRTDLCGFSPQVWATN